MNQPIKKCPARKRYDKEFKRQSVEHWLQSHRPGPAVAKELGINPNLLYRWRDSLVAPAPPPKEGGVTKRATEELEAENAQLRRDNDALRQQRDILKKTLGILSEPPNNGISGSKP